MTARTHRLALVAWSAALLLALVGCGEELVPGDDDDDATDAFTQLYQTATFQQCADCHAPGADGFTEGTEATQDWSSRDRAYQTLQGTASGLIGNFAACNGAPFLVDGQPENSLLFAIFDEDTRLAFQAPGVPGCDADAVSDHTLPDRVGPVPNATLTLLEDWILAGAPNR